MTTKEFIFFLLSIPAVLVALIYMPALIEWVIYG